MENDLCEDHACNGCLKFDEFGKSCWVFWERKKECSMKVATNDAWQKEKRVLQQ